MDSTSQALAVRYVQKPQDGHADTVAKLSFSPSFVTYNPVTIQNIQDFFKTGEGALATGLGLPSSSLCLVSFFSASLFCARLFCDFPGFRAQAWLSTARLMTTLVKKASSWPC